MIRTVRTASCGTLVPPKVSPSSVTLLLVGRCPATEKAAAVESDPGIATTPGASVARMARSLASIGSRATWFALSVFSVDPGVGGPPAAPPGGPRLPRPPPDHDLLELGDRRAHREVGDQAVLVGLPGDGAHERRLPDRAHDEPVLPAAVGEEQGVQIGRASCRERV